MVLPRKLFFFLFLDEDGRRHEDRDNFIFIDFDAKANGAATESDGAFVEDVGYDDRAVGTLGEGGDDTEHVAFRFQSV